MLHRDDSLLGMENMQKDMKYQVAEDFFIKKVCKLNIDREMLKSLGCPNQWVIKFTNL